MIVIVSGPPGAGKTTTAAGLAANADRAVHVVSDELFRWITSGFVAPHLPEAHRQNTAVLDATIAVVVTYADAGYDVYWDGVVGPWWLDRIADGLGDRATETHWIVLRPRRSTSVSRVAARDGTSDTSGAGVMADRFAALGDDERFVIDAEGEAATIAERCAAAIRARSHVLADRT